MVYRKGTFILSDAQLDRLAALMDVERQDRAAVKSELGAKFGDSDWRFVLPVSNMTVPPPCAWNLLLRRRYPKKEFRNVVCVEVRGDAGTRYKPFGVTKSTRVRHLLPAKRVQWHSADPLGVKKRDSHQSLSS